MRQLHRNASIIGGIFTLVQAIIYSIFAVYGCAVFTCLAKYPLPVDLDHKTDYLLYLAYFKGKCDSLVGVGWSGVSDAANRTYYVLIVYGIASAVWIPTSTLLVVAAISRMKGSSGAWLYYPWIANSIILLVVDVVGGIWYGIDISKTLTAKDFIKFIGDQVGPTSFNMDGITVVPSAIMTAIFLRGVIILLLNAIFLGVVIQACREVKKSFSTSEFIRGSAPKHIQREMEKTKETKEEDPEVRWVRVTEEVLLPRIELPPPPPERAEPPPERSENVRQPRNREYALSPQSPIADGPSPVIKRRSSLRRTGSSPVFDVRGNPTGETFPFPQDPNRRYIVNPPRFVDVEEREREMNRERQIERETDRELARLRELDRERQDREFQRLKGAADSNSNQRPWSYVNPSDLKLTPKYDKTMKPRFAPPDVPPKPSIPSPDYAANSPTEKVARWDPTNLSRPNAGANDQRWNHSGGYSIYE